MIESDDPLLVQCSGAIVVINQAVSLSSPKDLATQYNDISAKCYSHLYQAFGPSNPELQAFKIALDSLNPPPTPPPPTPPPPILPKSHVETVLERYSATCKSCDAITRHDTDALDQLLVEICTQKTEPKRQLKLTTLTEGDKTNAKACAASLKANLGVICTVIYVAV